MASAQSTGKGLLSGIGDVSTASWYTEKLEYSEDLLAKEGVFWEAARKDAKDSGMGESDEAVVQYMTNLITSLEGYMETEHVFDRVVLKAELKEKIQEKKKRMSILLGGKSIGKSQVLASVAKEVMEEANSEVMVVYVNAREFAGGSMKDGIHAALNGTDEKFFDKIDWKSIGKSMAKLLQLADKTKKIGEIAEEITDLMAAMSLCGNPNDVVADTNYVKLLIELAKEKNKRPCLIVDEANLYLKGGPAEDPLIHQFLNLTKEKHELKLILCSSKHSYPAQLCDSGLQLDLVDLCYAMEPSPSAMWSFLTEEKLNGKRIIGMGGNLAELSISLAGGHLPTIEALLKIVKKDKERFEGNQVLKNLEGAHKIEEALGTDDSGKIRELLASLARLGYATDKKFQRTSLMKKNIAGWVNNSITLLGEGSEDITMKSDRLLPSNCALRNLIAFYLHTMPVLRSAPGSPSNHSM